MRSFVALFLTSLISASVAQAQHEPRDVPPEELNALVARLHEDYSGDFIAEIDGSVRAIPHGKGDVLVEVDGLLAKYLLYNAPADHEKISYIPSEPGASWSNYFIRRTPAMNCGLGSYDLKRDPFPKFKCRFVVKKDGRVKPYFDRPNIPYRDFYASDFLFEKIKAPDSQANSYSFIRVQDPKQSHSLQLFDEAAELLYNSLQVPESDDSMGNIPLKKKSVTGLWCFRHLSTVEALEGRAQGYKCRLTFNKKGRLVDE